jgi:hypothetical protein
MKHIKKFENFDIDSNSTKVNEEFGGLGILALGGLALASGAIYTTAKRMWSKHVTGSKYTPTGNQETVINEETGGKEVLSEYKDKEGNLYWAYDHMWNPDPMVEDTPRNNDLYRGVYHAKDKNRLIKFLKGIKVKTSEPSYDYFDIPEAADMIFLKDYDKERIETGNF